MRSSFLLLLLSTALPSYADWNDYDYQEERELAVDAGGLQSLRVDAGAGSLAIRGVDGGDQIEVTATVLVSGAEGDRAERGHLGNSICAWKRRSQSPAPRGDST